MKRFIRKTIYVLLISVGGILLLFLLCTQLTERRYADSYARVLVRKYDHLIGTKGPKLIIVGGSNLAFGLDSKLLSESIGRPVVNLGLHFGFGQSFQLSLAKANLQPGDTVLIAFEDDYWQRVIHLGGQLTLAAIGSRYDIYRCIPLNEVGYLLSAIPEATADAIGGSGGALGTAGNYRAEDFDLDGELIRVFPDFQPMDNYSFQKRSLDADRISAELMQCVNEFITYANKRGAAVAVTFSPLLSDCLASDPSDIQAFEDALSAQLNAPVISHVSDYLFSEDEMFDTEFHLNARSRITRTERLAADLARSGLLE